jgi:hypothetical protein
MLCIAIEYGSRDMSKAYSPNGWQASANSVPTLKTNLQQVLPGEHEQRSSYSETNLPKSLNACSNPCTSLMSSLGPISLTREVDHDTGLNKEKMLTDILPVVLWIGLT